MNNTFFLTGTDTGIGKTLVAAALLEKAKALGLSSLGLKPVAAGVEEKGLGNEDAMGLMESASVKLDYAEVNPVLLEAPLAPHIAAAQEGRELSLKHLVEACRGALRKQADFTVIEGAGGWNVPLNDKESLADLPKALDIPVILVVGLRLGCLNHALLSAESIAHRACPLVGWVANEVDPDMQVKNENIAYLKEALNAPFLGHIPYLDSPTALQAADYLDLSPLVSTR